MSIYKSIVKAAVVAVLAVSAWALDTSQLKPSGYVNDFEHALDPRYHQQLENYLGQVERVTGAQIAIVTVETTDGEPVEDVANRLYHEWGIGKKGSDEGVLLLLAIKDRKQRAEIGKGLEEVITDAQAGDILRGIRPILRQGNYGGALLAASEQLGEKIAQFKNVDLAPERRVRRVNRTAQPGGIPIGVIIFGFIALLFLLSRMGRGGGGGGTGFLTGMILGNMMGRGSGWGGGGFGGSGGSDGGGFGGFGGGDSGGGGASSDW